jgi:molybdopterin-guanine dinucleotide biosynthesis protein A
MTVLGAIIAGGESRRFGGDKAAAQLGGKALIEHAIDALLPQVDALVIIGRQWQDYPSVDDHPFACGPLSGLCAALRLARSNGHDHVLSAGCDVLPLAPDLLLSLEGDGPAVIAGQRLIGLWPSALAERLEAHILTQSNYSMRHWVKLSGAREVVSSVALYNLNTPQDLAGYPPH